MVGGPARTSSNKSTWNEPPFYICVRSFSEIDWCLMKDVLIFILARPRMAITNGLNHMVGVYSWRAKRIHIHTHKRKKQKNTWDDDDDDDADARHWTRMCSWCINVFLQLNLKKMKHIDSISSFISKVSLNVSTWPKRVCQTVWPLFVTTTQWPKQFNLSFLYFLKLKRERIESV